MRKTRLHIAVCMGLSLALFSYVSIADESNATTNSNVHVSIRKVSDQWDEAVQTLSGETQNGSWAGYSLGDGVAKDLSEAMKWLNRKAERGYADAQDVWNEYYSKGEGVAKDWSEALKKYHESAGQKVAEVQAQWERCTTNDTGVVKDLSEAMKWLRKAAEDGPKDAQQIWQAMGGEPAPAPDKQESPQL